MIRKYMFGSLTLVLIFALAFLFIRGQKMEKQQAGRVMEVVQEEIATPTRVLAPREIKIDQTKMTFAGQSAQHEIDIRNLGRTSYSAIQLRLEYLNAKGKTMTIKTHSIRKVLSPGGTLHVPDIKIDHLPVSISDCKVTIISADLSESYPNLK
jgi:hypothetical protein